jgi:hypothetical protein
MRRKDSRFADLALSGNLATSVAGRTQGLILGIAWAIPLAVTFLQLGARNLARAVVPADYRPVGRLVFIDVVGWTYPMMTFGSSLSPTRQASQNHFYLA